MIKMKLFAENHTPMVTVVLHDTYLACAIVEQKNCHSKLQLHSYQYHQLTKQEIADGIIYNISHIVSYLKSFFQQEKISSPFITFALSGSLIHDRILETATAYFTPHQHKHKVKHALYLGPHTDHGFIFYEYTVPQTVILQCTLIAHLLNAHLLTITTTSAALFSTYKGIRADVYRASHLYDEMQRGDNTIERLFSRDMLHRIVSMEHQLKDNDIIPIAASCGHHFYERTRT
jgi:hypothetical protein